MPKETSDYGTWLSGKLADSGIAIKYLNAAIGESPTLFLKALRKVSESHQMAKVAEQADVSRESLYRMLSGSGNPTFSNLSSILKALEFRIVIVRDTPRTHSSNHETPRTETQANSTILGTEGVSGTRGIESIALQSSASENPIMTGANGLASVVNKIATIQIPTFEYGVPGILVSGGEAPQGPNQHVSR